MEPRMGELANALRVASIGVKARRVGVLSWIAGVCANMFNLLWIEEGAPLKNIYGVLFVLVALVAPPLFTNAMKFLN